jgi:ABC-type nitrate/sulfonate/bicarbonate transport system substrate-binding protein
MVQRVRVSLAAAAVLIAVAVFAMAGCGSSSDESSGSSGSSGSTSSDAGGRELTKVKLLVASDSGENIFYYPFGMAQSLGYYRDAGIDMEFVPGNGGSGVVQQIVSGNSDAGLTSPAAILVAGSQGHELKVPFSFVYGPTFDVVVTGDSPVRTMADLDGKTIGVSEASGGEVPFVRALMKDAGIEADVVPVGFGLQAADALKNGRVQAYSSGVVDFQQMKSAGFDFRRISPPQVGEFPGTGITISPKAWDENRDMWVAFLRETARAQHYALTHPDEALEVMRRRLPDAFENPDSGKAFFDAMLDITVPPGGVEGDHYGEVNVQGWKDYQDFLLSGAKGDDGDVLTRPADIDAIIDNSESARINDFPKTAK